MVKNVWMRCTLSRGLSALCLSTVLLLTWTLLRQSRDKLYTQTCHHPEQFQTRLHRLAETVHHILRANSLTHFICYGSLWGQIRLSRSLPWEATVQFCLLNEELSKNDEVFLMLAFKKHRLHLAYNSAEGTYAVSDPTFEGGSVEMIVFEEDPLVGMLRRVGWKRRVLPPDCESMTSLQCFPPRLVAPPLPLKEFGGVVVPVPREGIEIQKYHYPDNWWKEVLPKNC